jgi:hypothetical protein
VVSRSWHTRSLADMCESAAATFGLRIARTFRNDAKVGGAGGGDAGKFRATKASLTLRLVVIGAKCNACLVGV